MFPEQVRNSPTGKPKNKRHDNLERIRNNQRRSRAARRQQLEDLQKKVQMYEKEGVQATVDMQKAAQDVDNKAKMLHSENQKLREILYRFGMSENDIQLQLNSRNFMNTAWKEPSMLSSTNIDHTVTSPASGYVPNLDTKRGQQTSVSNQELYSRPNPGMVGPSIANSLYFDHTMLSRSHVSMQEGSVFPVTREHEALR